MGFNEKALFSDVTEDYIYPPEPEEYGQVTVTFRAGTQDVLAVYIIGSIGKRKMYLARSAGDYDFYQYSFLLENKMVSYGFEIHAKERICYYDIRGVADNQDSFYQFKINPGLSAPQWAKGAVMYQIYVDRFCNGDTTNDICSHEYSYIGEHVSFVDDWNKYPSTAGFREFYGGDLQGVLDKLDYLQDLGVEVIYFNPLFVSPSNHKYDIQDYENIDPHLGVIVKDEGNLLPENEQNNTKASRYITRVTEKENLDASNAFFAKVIDEIHKRGMKVILDGVFNHCGSFNKWLDKERIYENAPGYEKGAYVAENSPYHNYFEFTGGKWPYNGQYNGWWGHDTLPKLNYETSDELRHYILKVAKKWVSPPYNADGWRLDVAADLGHSEETNHEFWKEFREAVRLANPEAIVLAEHYGDPSRWLYAGEWDTVMNYDAFMEPVTWFFTGMQKHSDEYREDLFGNQEAFISAMKYHLAHFTAPGVQIAMNELSNHDHSRFLTRTSKKVGRVEKLGPEEANTGVNKAILREAVVVQMTWIGAPTIYYGDEAGVCGFTDPDNRRSFPWGKEDKELIAFHKEIIRIHKEFSSIKTGSLKYIDSDYNFLAYGRFNQKEQVIILINNREEALNREMEVWQLGMPKDATVTQLICSDRDGFTVKNCFYKLVDGMISITMPPLSAIVLGRVSEPLSERKNFLQFI